jgi:hypothetical protein
MHSVLLGNVVEKDTKFPFPLALFGSLFRSEPESESLDPHD